jgi:hypothetical protein
MEPLRANIYTNITGISLPITAIQATASSQYSAISFNINEFPIGVAILVARAGRKIESISLRSFFKPKQLQKVKNECFHTQYVHTAKSAIRDAEVAIAAHSIHQPNQNIKIGSSIILTPQAISVGIILIFASHTQRSTQAIHIHKSRNG